MYTLDFQSFALKQVPAEDLACSCRVSTKKTRRVSRGWGQLLNYLQDMRVLNLNY